MKNLLIISFLVVGGGVNVAVDAATVTVATGQTVTTARTLSTGGALKIKLVSLNGELKYLPLVVDQAKPGTTLQGILEWMNVLGVGPRNMTGQTPAFNDAIQDSRFELDDPLSRGNVRTGMRIRSSGTSVGFDSTSGLAVTFAGFQHSELETKFKNNTLAGGYWRANGVQYSFASPLVVGNLTGVHGAVGTSPSSVAVPQTGVELWSYDTITGPTVLPLAEIAAAPNTAAIPGILQAAGFNIVSSTSSEVVFSGVLYFLNVKASAALLDYMCLTWGCSPIIRSAANIPATQAVGQFVATVRYSIPLAP